MLLIIILCVVFALVVVMRATLVVVRVRGGSMRPTLFDGDLLVGARCRPCRTGSLIVFRSESSPGGRDSYLVKRVAAVPGQLVPLDFPELSDRIVPPEVFLVRGDAARSLDSRQLGYISISAVVAVTICGLIPFRRLAGKQSENDI
ncbi:S26 family signal peptidase [Streptosporangium sp. G11]|uniref:S26 family signal peptidase n=1 Tax=Streptosporangium sp. G11 TaxID=3436926 RepID=UPI003EBA196C